jgi:tRNA-dihydrouridine synthase B
MVCPKDNHLLSSKLAAPFSIGSVSIRNRVILAPMSGVTDLPFRQLALRYGAGLVVTEMVASRELVQDTAESWARLRSAGLKPHMVQLAGREAHWMAEAAKIAGSALMRDPDHALTLIEATVRAVNIPVTLKMRLGWDENSINAPYIARRAEEAGIQLVTIHGRTRMQFYEGRADWDAICAVRDAVSIPLVANGDVETAEDAQEILRRSGADAVMIGRGCQGRPWHAGVLAGHREPSRQEIVEIALEHYRMMLEFYGEAVGIRHARKHLAWYLDRYAPATAAADKAKIMTSKDSGEVAASLRAALQAGADLAQCVQEAA